jgi:hypothetical protein
MSDDAITVTQITVSRVIADGEMEFRVKIPPQGNTVELLGMLLYGALQIFTEMRDQ